VVPVPARYRGRPIVAVPPALAPVPEIVAPFPGPRPLSVRLDVTPFLTGSGFTVGQPAMPERVLVDDVVRAYRVDDDGRLLARVLEPRAPGDAEREIVVPNPTDRAAVLAAFADGAIDGLADSHAVFLAASHPFGARLFTPVTAAAITLPAFDDALPNRAVRVVYRLRAVDAAGRVSLDGATLQGIVRVPAAASIAAPTRASARDGDPAGRLRLEVRGGADVTHVLVFSHVHPTRVRLAAVADLLWRPVPALPDDVAARVRLPDGTLLTPTLRSLSGPDAEGDVPYRAVFVDASVGDDERVTLWTSAVTRDGWLSPLAGPWTI
jgi:hypothetical protein